MYVCTYYIHCVNVECVCNQFKVISNKQQMRDRKTLKFNSNVKVIDLTGKEKRTFSSYQEIHQQPTKPDEDSSKCINGCVAYMYMCVCTYACNVMYVCMYVCIRDATIYRYIAIS